MIPNYSPWIKQLNRTRPAIPLGEDLKTDVAIVGGGIAGVVSAYFTLRDTDKNVVLLEADRIAHGATGHNAGQITGHFERPLVDIVAEFGLEAAISGQKSIESAWLILEEIYSETGLQTPLYRFTGYTGFTNEDQLLAELKNASCRATGGLIPDPIMISDESGIEYSIPDEFKKFYSVVPQSDILSILEAKKDEYIAAVAQPKGCLNSALFTEELVGYLLAKHRGRFDLFEESPVSRVVLKEGIGGVEVLGHQVTAERILLCTNGFENFHIKNEAGADIDTKFHHLVLGRIGYMAGYIEPLASPPITISYFPKVREHPDDPTGEGYFYLTRRPHEKDGTDNLVCTGGPEKVLPNQALYSRQELCNEEMREIIDSFLIDNYKNYPEGGTEYAFCWHGLMGYTPNGIRRIGFEPCNPVLMYNLGCNGVGILPSIYGGKRISQLLSGEQLEQSIFDPIDQRCEVAPASPELQEIPATL